MITGFAAVLCATTAVHILTRPSDSSRRLARCFPAPRRSRGSPDGLLRHIATAATLALAVLVLGLPSGS
ncbi:hypothetical protein [Actinomadura sp. WMMB 499]|uniref:hypothetical protein n=1 Tax=Actinomadura sp. WMMB 499 TaxID=1219491 RepID=UPI0020C831DE|nr:hypothetical protein [Actinomadura sp. WMMB 499]